MHGTDWCHDMNMKYTSCPRRGRRACRCSRGEEWGTGQEFPEDRKYTMLLTSANIQCMYIQEWVYRWKEKHSHWGHPSCPLDRRLNPELSGEYFSLLLQTKSSNNNKKELHKTKIQVQFMNMFQVYEKRGQEHGDFWGILPGFCLQAQPPRWQCSAGLEASVSGLHSRGDPSYCLLTTRDNIRLRNRLPNIFLIDIQKVYFVLLKSKDLREKSHHWGQTPQCFFSSQRSKNTGLWTLRLKLMIVGLSQTGGEDKVSMILRPYDRV